MKRRHWILSCGAFAAVALGFAFLVVALVLRSAIPSFMYPEATAMPAATTKPFGEILDTLESALRSNAPELLLEFQAGADPALLRDLEKQSKLTLSDDLKSLYQKWNGMKPETTAPLLADHRFVPIEEAVSSTLALQSATDEVSGVEGLGLNAVAGHRRHWIQILDDGAGDGYFFDPKRSPSQGQYFYHFTETGTYVFFPSLGNMLLYLAECYEEGLYREGKTSDVQSMTRAEELWKKYGEVHPADEG